MPGQLTCGIPTLDQTTALIHRARSTQEELHHRQHAEAEAELVRQQQVEELRAQVSLLEPQTPD